MLTSGHVEILEPNGSFLELKLAFNTALITSPYFIPELKRFVRNFPGF